MDIPQIFPQGELLGSQSAQLVPTQIFPSCGSISFFCTFQIPIRRAIVVDLAGNLGSNFPFFSFWQPRVFIYFDVVVEVL